MKKTNLLAILFAVFSLCFCTVSCSEPEEPTPGGGTENPDGPDNPDDPDEPNTPKPDGVVKTMTLDLGTKYQTIDGFAASDCWTGNYVGKDWNENAKGQVAEWLFSQEFNSMNGSPKGIGLSMWRFNLGAGSAQQGDKSDIKEKSRRSDSFLNEDGTYNWTRHAGQRYFLEKAKEMGCEHFVMFSNSPPTNFTKNGIGHTTSGNNANLKEDCYDDFAEYMAEVLEHMSGLGLNFSYVSPVNEPQFSWNTDKQEGTPWQNSEVAHIVRELDKSITSRGLSTQIFIGEAGKYSFNYEGSSSKRSDCIDDFFTATSDNYIGDLPSVASIISGHGYWEDSNWNMLQSGRKKFWEAANAKGLRTYQTEWSTLGDNYNDNNFVPYKECDYLDIAMYMSQVIHHDMVNANCSSWSYWTAMDQERWSHKNRFLMIALEPGGNFYGDIQTSGNVYARKNLWVLGNYSRFIRPGFRRVELAIDEPSTMFFGSAYMSPDDKQIVMVFTNFTSKLINPMIDFEEMGVEVESIERYVTNAASDLRLKTDSNDGLLRVEGKSVVTIVVNLK